MLVDSGVERLSGQIHEHVWAAYARHDDEVTGALLSLKQYGRAMRDALVASDFGGVRQVMFENWVQQKRLHPSVTNETVESLFDRAMASGATAGKACGAGGGGALVFYASSVESAQNVRRALDRSRRRDHRLRLRTGRACRRGVVPTTHATRRRIARAGRDGG